MLNIFSKSIISFTLKSLFIFLFAITSSLSYAAHIAFWGTSAGELEDAMSTAGAGGSVTLTQDLTFSSPVQFYTPNVTIWGAGKTITEAGQAHNMFIILTPNIKISNVKFAAQSGGNFRAMISPRSSGLTVENCQFNDGSGGIRVVGEPPKSLTIRNNTFLNVPTAIAINRDVVRIVGSNQVARALNGGFMQIIGNTISNPTIAGITIDAGNDGGANSNGSSAGNGDPRFPQQNSPLRAQVNGKTTNYFSASNKRSVISNNSITGVGGFGIALARVNGINVLNNTVHLANSGKSFRRGIHLENRTNGILIANNTVNLSGGTGNPSAIGFVTFSDYGNSNNIVNGTSRVEVRQNQILGQGRGIVGSGFRQLHLIRNNLTGVNGLIYSFFNVAGGQNTFATVTGNTPQNP